MVIAITHPMHRRKRRHPVLVGLLMAALPALCPVAANAEPPSGRLLAAQCAQCHGTDGRGGFEDIAGKPASDLYNDLREMKQRPPETIMDRQARGYTDAQLRAIADYLAALPGRPD
jgi:sulfide dehydrogenase cytochrome subunit